MTLIIAERWRDGQCTTRWTDENGPPDLAAQLPRLRALGWHIHDFREQGAVMVKPGTIGKLLADARDEERAWQKKAEPSPGCLPWMPADIAQFLLLLLEAVAAQHGAEYLEVGCGPGTKLELAREMFGLAVHGIEKDPEMAAAAAVRLGPGTVREADALGWPFYAAYDIVFFNRVFRDEVLEAELEAQVWRDMRRGAAVICMNLAAPPPGWLPVTDDWEARRGVWIKP